MNVRAADYALGERQKLIDMVARLSKKLDETSTTLANEREDRTVLLRTVAHGSSPGNSGQKTQQLSPSSRRSLYETDIITETTTTVIDPITRIATPKVSKAKVTVVSEGPVLVRPAKDAPSDGGQHTLIQNHE